MIRVIITGAGHVAVFSAWDIVIGNRVDSANHHVFSRQTAEKETVGKLFTDGGDLIRFEIPSKWGDRSNQKWKVLVIQTTSQAGRLSQNSPLPPWNTMRKERDNLCSEFTQSIVWYASSFQRILIQKRSRICCQFRMWISKQNNVPYCCTKPCSIPATRFLVQRSETLESCLAYHWFLCSILVIEYLEQKRLWVHVSRVAT